ncbi:MAG: GNAT family N-acetyltransferase [Deinococcales bacterium]|nr:GNAT family N-acetyltransferase [Deinococcales bacterium]
MVPQAWTIRRLPLAEAEDRVAEMGGVYQRAFGYDRSRRHHFEQRLLMNLPRYRDVVVLAAEGPSGELLGFLYGYDLERGHWWPEQIAPALERAGLGDWLDDAFELAELEVDPPAQRQGIGSRLLRTLEGLTAHRHTLLSTTADPADRAKVLYRRHGFVDLLPGFRYGGVGDPAVIMGRRRA